MDPGGPHRAGPREVARYEVATCVRRDPGDVAGGCRVRRGRGWWRRRRGGPNEPVTLDFWVFESGGIGSFLKTLESGFEDANPNIDVNITAYPEENYGVKLDTGDRGGQGARPRPRLRPRADARGTAPAARRRRGGERHRPLDLRAGDRRARRRVQLLLRGQSLLPRVVRGLGADALQQGHVRRGRDRLPRGVAADDARRVRRHRLPAHRRGERGLGRSGLRPLGVRSRSTCCSARTGAPRRAT